MANYGLFKKVGSKYVQVGTDYFILAGIGPVVPSMLYLMLEHLELWAVCSSHMHLVAEHTARISRN